MEKVIEILEGVTAEVKENEVVVSGEKGELRRSFFFPKTFIKKDNNSIIAYTDVERKKNKAILGTWIAHVRNMMEGVTEGYSIKMKIVHKHFPMTIKIEGETFTINNVFGQKAPRTTKILDGVEVQHNGDELEIKGIDKEKVGNTASNIEGLCQKRLQRDRRVFYDGIYKVN